MIQKHDSASKQDKVQVWEEQRPVSKYALGLHQEPSTGRTIPSDPTQWACAETGVKENLWLNLSTGTVGSGRQASFAGITSNQFCQHTMLLHRSMLFDNQQAAAVSASVHLSTSWH